MLLRCSRRNRSLVLLFIALGLLRLNAVLNHFQTKHHISANMRLPLVRASSTLPDATLFHTSQFLRSNPCITLSQLLNTTTHEYTDSYADLSSTKRKCMYQLPGKPEALPVACVAGATWRQPPSWPELEETRSRNVWLSAGVYCLSDQRSAQIGTIGIGRNCE